MATLRQIREGLAANLASIPNLQQSAYMLSNPTPPSAEVVPGEVVYDQAFVRGHDVWMMKVRVMAGAVTDRGCQARLDRFLAPSGPDSVKAALESDPTLGGTVDDLHVQRSSGYQLMGRDGGGPVLSAEWDVEVLASN